jgi:2-succinyl-5-enolpyruvyl-6-hydroxy-3-cyclohexene-1-carboxylate synthase
MVFQAIVDLIELFRLQDVRSAVISPGSRNAPLSLAIARNSGIEHLVIPDERSAAFVALGMAEASGKPVLLCCTSGSAAYNYAPAIAEAYYRKVPLIVLTADRPPEWVDQLDGQTIRQQGLYGSHVKKSYQLPSDQSQGEAYWHINRIGNEAIVESVSEPKGPVHINCPFREPFYPAKNESFTPSENIRQIKYAVSEVQLGPSLLGELQRELGVAKKVLIVAGQQPCNEVQAKHLMVHSSSIPILADVISNLPFHANLIQHHDLFLGQVTDELKLDLQPDLLITFGLSVISKNVKTFLRNYPPKYHWHLQSHHKIADTFKHITRLINTRPSALFETQLFKDLASDRSYYEAWKRLSQKTAFVIANQGSKSWDEFTAVGKILNALPGSCNLHLANSMTVRWANFIGIHKPEVMVYCNRGTSGIDGSSSTALGIAFSTKKLNVLITGDMAFQYDRNAFWHKHIPKNLRIIVLNNSGGGIFGLIEGPSKQEELDEVFVADHFISAKSIADAFNLDYFKADNYTALSEIISDYFKPEGGSKILELMFERNQTKEVFNSLKRQLKQSYEA